MEEIHIVGVVYRGLVIESKGSCLSCLKGRHHKSMKIMAEAVSEGVEGNSFRNKQYFLNEEKT